MKDSIEIYVANTGKYTQATGGETLLDISAALTEPLPFAPICAYVNNKNESLKFPVYSPKTVEYMPVTSPSGNRTYIRSLCMMLYHAVNTLMPDASLRIEHSISGGYFCRLIFPDGRQADEAAVGALCAHMHGLTERNLPFVRNERRTPEVIEIFRRQRLMDKVELLSTVHEIYTVYYTLDGLSDCYYGPLAPSTGLINVFDLIPYRDGMLLLGPEASNPAVPARAVPMPKMYEAFKRNVVFNSVIGISSVGRLNREVEKGDARNIINVSEALHNNLIADITNTITERFRAGNAKVVLVAGPSSSGKTTFTKRLAIQLMTNLIKPKMISLDDYFVDREQTPKDADGEYDYESLYALDLDLFNTHINALLRGEEVELPTYNFQTGRREFKGNRLSLGPDNILLIEGIHGLNPELTSHVNDDMKYRIYVSALTTISIDDHNWIPTTDNRLLRRMVRDAKYRGVSPVDTIRRWPSVRRGEERWIFPYQENADVMFNSALLFELGVMKTRAEELLRQVPHDVIEYAEAARLRRFLSYFISIPETYIPSTSLLREFLGGSSFKY